jgi:aldehyde:ferredoxin oxidoreductase
MTIKYEGYTGTWLHIDLTSGRIEPRELDPTLAEGYLGGNGFGSHLLWERVGPGVDPLAPENILVFATGPLCGTGMPTSGRVAVVAKSPLTGIYGDSNAGGHFGPELKFAGWDMIVFTGRAAYPVYLHILDSQVELRDARDLWGLTTSRAEEAIRNAWGDDKIKTAIIGPAGEHLVRFAGIQVTSQRSAARCPDLPGRSRPWHPWDRLPDERARPLSYQELSDGQL